LYLPHTAVHVPIRPSSAFQGKSSNGAFGDWVEELDWSVGRILDTLGELGLDQQTLVFFTSDNGPWLTQGANGGVAGPLRGGKGSTWEGGVREPTLAWWPGKIAPASTCDAVAVNFDLLPTFVALAGGTPPADRKIDGRDLSGLLLGTSTQSPREAHFFYRGYKLEAVRVGHWKLAIHPQVENLYEKTEPVDASKEMPRLYNLTDDIGERTNVAAEHPDVVERLLALTATMAAELGDGKPGPEARPAGLEAEPKLLYPSSHSDKTKKPKGRPDAKKNA
jgi:arylsulfatase A-like enzyme